MSYLKDSYTATIATGLATRIESLTGQKPHLVKLEIKRNKLDASCKLEIDEATFGNSDAQDVYYEYFNTVDQVRQ